MASELGFANIGGIFVILAIGLVLSMIVAAVEFSIKIRNRKGRQVNFELRKKKRSKNKKTISFRFRFEKKWNVIFVLLFSTSVHRNVVQVFLSKTFHYSILMITIHIEINFSFLILFVSLKNIIRQ